MAYCRRRGLFDNFFDHRNSLIIQYKNGDISKREFLEGNFDFVEQMNVKPFSQIDSYEKGMYNYQYYNVLAKYYTMLAKDMKREGQSDKYYTYYLNEGNYYYREKDRATLQLLRFLDFKNIEAYFIKVESKFLKDKLYEIVLKDYEYAIFHSKSKWLLEILRKEGIFIEGKKVSLIDEYINETY
ncbi:hypothetical protein NSA23_13200 [Anaerosalibacter massiliensis]|uniref:Uncharacterized protein n=1 Tax=Anaerosalibacter massiliensis TaxID=1347392 RepID=A0A9X2S668_9FIRM|nr:DUF6648 family protein [Anaerosalibacter massiliensis]MCR2045059.1 hypothetical protein [Anaerosalibacter massiliensis]